MNLVVGMSTPLISEANLEVDVAIARELDENESKTKFESSRRHVDALNKRSEFRSRRRTYLMNLVVALSAPLASGTSLEADEVLIV